MMRRGKAPQQASDCQKTSDVGERRDGYFYSDTPDVVAMCHLGI